MKISKKAYYGLRATAALAQAQKALSIHALAEGEQLPEDYLEKILQTLRRAGLVKATKGTTGGYALAKAPQDMSAWDVLRELDGPIKVFSLPNKGTLPCFHVSHCQTNEVFRKLENKIEESLSQIKLSELGADIQR